MIIYKITNSVNGKVYIGYDSNDKEQHVRFKDHLRDAENGSNRHLHRAIRKYGSANFTCETLESGINDKNILKDREIYWIGVYDSYLGNGYNMTRGGDGGTGNMDNITSKRDAWWSSLSKDEKSLLQSGRSRGYWNTMSPREKEKISTERSKTVKAHWDNMDEVQKKERLQKTHAHLIKFYKITDSDGLTYYHRGNIRDFCRLHPVSRNALYVSAKESRSVSGWNCEIITEEDYKDAN